MLSATLSSPFAGVDPATLQVWLTAAQTAYYKIASGGGVVEVVTQGDVVKYNRTNVGDLLALIAQLQAALAGRSSIGAIGVLWAD